MFLILGHKISITDQIRRHLQWWNNKERFIQGIALKPTPATHSLFSDASDTGWVAHLEPEGLLFHGVWTTDQSKTPNECPRNDGHIP